MRCDSRDGRAQQVLHARSRIRAQRDRRAWRNADAERQRRQQPAARGAQRHRHRRSDTYEEQPGVWEREVRRKGGRGLQRDQLPNPAGDPERIVQWDERRRLLDYRRYLRHDSGRQDGVLDHRDLLPGALGTESATLTVADSPDPRSPYAVALSTGPTIPATVTPITLAYGTLTSKIKSKTENVTVTNLSKFLLPLSESFSGANAGDFAVTGGTCTDTAAAKSSCTIAVTFTPTGGGSAESASMAVTVGSD